MVKAAVERKFLVIGEALRRLKREHPEIIEKITGHENIIGFRNVLVHDYLGIDLDQPERARKVGNEFEG